MPEPESTSTHRIFVGAWVLARDHHTKAQLWLVTPPQGRSIYYEAEVTRNGQTIETLTKPTREAITRQLEERYGRGT